MSIVAKFIPGMTWPPGVSDPTPSEGQVFVPIPNTLSWTCVNSVSQDEQGNWIFTENEEQKSIFWRDLREFRNKYLAECDWTQLPDATVDKEAWATYRQALRNLPANTVDPAMPNWPEKPS